MLSLPRAWPNCCWRRAFTWSPSPTPSCQWARLAFGRRFRRRIHARNWSSRSSALSKPSGSYSATKRAITSSKLLTSQSLRKGVEEVQRLSIGVDGKALILAVGSVVAAFQSYGGEAIAWNARLGEVDAVGCAVFHHCGDRYAGPDLVRQRGERLEDLRQRRRGYDGLAFGRGVADDSGIGDVFDAQLGVGEEVAQFFANLFRGVTGKDPAVHVGLRRLSESVVGVTGGEAGGDAGGAEVGIEARLDG